MIKYIGSKRLLLPRIVAQVQGCAGVTTVLDAFSGTARVGHALKAAGYRVHANDHNAYAHVLAGCHVAADARRWRAKAERLLAELARVKGRPGWFTATFCERARYLRPENGARVDAIRERIERLGLEPPLRAIALTALMRAADRVDSTTGVQMAYLKQWAPRAHHPLELRMPEVLPGPGRATCLDALTAVQRHAADLVYLDPPYNQHSYLGNYHVWESLVRWDKPDVYGIAMKRTDVRTRTSAYNRPSTIGAALRAVVEAAQAKWLLVSFSDEGFVPLLDLRAILATRGHVREVSVDHPRYIGHRIGIHDRQGRKVGVPGKARNREHLFLVQVGARAPRVRRVTPRVRALAAAGA